VSIGGTGRALIVLIRDTTVELLTWQRRRLSSLGLLAHDDQNLPLFRSIVQQHRNWPVIIVADLLDENFRHDTIVHVTGSDHQALLRRKLEFSFRNTRYRRGIVTGRMSDGRKDDRVMLCALTRPELIDKWANLLLQEKMPIQAVTSLAHLLNLYVPLEGLEHEEYLLISMLDSDNLLRQSFVSKGRMLFSRQASLVDVPEKRLGVEILQESVQLRQYLERIHFVPYEKRLEVQVLAATTDATLKVEKFSSESHHFTVVDIAAQQAASQVELGDEVLEPSHALLARILAHRSIDNIYAPPALTRYHDLRSFGRLLQATAAAILLVGLGLNIPGLMDLADKREQTAVLRTSISALQREYQGLRQRFPETPIPAQTMSLLVDTHEKLLQQNYNPVAELNLVATALARSPGLELTSIEWHLREDPDAAKPDAGRNQTRRTQARATPTAGDPLATVLLEQRSRVELVIEGETYSPSSYRDAQEQVLDFAEALAATEGVKVQMRQMPIEVRSDAQVSTLINDSEVRSRFILDVYVDKSASARLIAGVRQP
jgi:hypothetical protein